MRFADAAADEASQLLIATTGQSHQIAFLGPMTPQEGDLIVYLRSETCENAQQQYDQHQTVSADASVVLPASLERGSYTLCRCDKLDAVPCVWQSKHWDPVLGLAIIIRQAPPPAPLLPMPAPPPPLPASAGEISALSIALGTTAAVLALILTILGLIWYRRRRKRKARPRLPTYVALAKPYDVFLSCAPPALLALPHTSRSK